MILIEVVKEAVAMQVRWFKSAKLEICGILNSARFITEGR